MRQAIGAEWAKAWSVPGTAWLLAGLAALTVAAGSGSVAAARCPAAGCGQDPATISLVGVYVAQAVAALAGVAAIGGEYATGMIRVTLTAVPRRTHVLAAKALVLAGPALAVAAGSVGASALAGQIVLPGHGFTAAHGFDLASGAMWRADGCAVAYLVLVALLGLGVTAAVRDSAVATGIVLGILYLFPVAAGLVTSQTVQRRLEQIGPMPAAMDSFATEGLRGLPLSPWQGLGVVALWAVGALVLGGLALWCRDA
ncbi:MAG: ABC transporter permease [Trebonia sp.]